MRTCSIFLGLAMWLLAGCDSQEAQEEFLQMANAVPAGYTQVLPDGTVCEGGVDTDDWRTSPVYNGVVLVEKPPFPNPTSGNDVVITIRVLQFDRVQGSLQLVSYPTSNITPVQLDIILDANAPGEYVFIFNPSLLTENGLHRLFVIDQVGELVSYGDLLLSDEVSTSC